jgi:maleate isomerase
MHRLPDHLKPYPIGWKAKLGFLVPSHDSGYGSYEMRVMSPDGVTPLETRVPGRTVTHGELKSMSDSAVEAAAILSDADPDIVDFIPTAPCFVMGVESEADMIRAITERTGIQATAGGLSVAEALRFVGARRIIMYTPYLEDIQDLTNRYFNDQGFEVLGSRNLRFEDPSNINRVSPYEILSGIVQLQRRYPEADGVFVVGGCFRTLEITAQLEELIGVPVVGTQQANMFNCLRLCGVADLLEGFGRLLAEPRLTGGEAARVPSERASLTAPAGSV